MKLKVFENIAKIVSKTKLKCIEKSPELLFIGGAVAGLSAIVLTYKKTLTFEKILEDHNEQLARQEEAARIADMSSEDTYPAKERKLDRAKVYFKTGMKTAVHWLPVVIAASASLIMFGKSFGILKGRYFEMAAYAATLVKENDSLKDEILKLKSGDGKTVMDGSGEVVEAEPEQQNEYDRSIVWKCAKFFDESNENWEKNAEYNKDFIIGKQQWANRILKRDGFLLLNDVYDWLGLPKTQFGNMFGWKYYKDPEEAKRNGATNEVKFGLDYDSQQVRDFINGYERSVLLRFNVDPLPIIDKIGWDKI